MKYAADDDLHAAGEPISNKGPRVASVAPPTDNVTAPPFWQNRLTKTQEGNIRSTQGNGLLVLRHDEQWRGVLGYDVRAEEPVFLKAPPLVDCATTQAPRSISDADDVRIAQWLEERYAIILSVTQINQIVNAVAADAPFSEVGRYLEGLSAWDGQPRLNTWLHRLLGVTDSPYASAVGSKWMISAVAREFRPGCKCDHVLILEGDQGIGKSTALRTLAGAKHFGDDIPALGSKDSQQYLGALWIVELAEMDAATKAEAATLKRFLTTTEDKYRPPYGRRTIQHARRCVFAGSVNFSEYLKDSSGGRRFWPVSCTRVDLQALTSERDQLWAEALHRYRAGEPWHLDAATEQLAQAEQSARLEPDPWEQAIQAYLSRLQADFVTTPDLLEHALDISKARMTKADQNRVGGVMRRLSWKYKEGKSRQKGWKRP